MKRWVWQVALILFLAISVIFYKFNEIPIYIAPDEIAFVRLALALENLPLTLYTTLETGHSTLYFYLLQLSFSIFGVSLFALRLPSALFGILNCVLLLFLLKIVFKNKKISIKLPYQKATLNINIGLILSVAFIFMRWHFNFARFSFEATFLLFLELVSLISILLYVENKKWVWLGLSILFAGLSFYSYTPGRIFFLVPLAILAFCVNVKNKFKMIILFFGAFVCIIAPLVFQMASVGGDVRVGEELILFDSGVNFAGKVHCLFENIEKTTQMFGFAGDMNGRHNYPGKAALNPILFILFLGGLYAAILKRRFMDIIFLLYFAVSLIPTILTHPTGNPNMLRTISVIIPVIYFVGIFIEELLTFGSAKKYGNYIGSILVAFIVLSSIYELRSYFVFQKEVTRNSFEVKKSFEWVKNRDFQLVGRWYRE